MATWTRIRLIAVGGAPRPARAAASDGARVLSGPEEPARALARHLAGGAAVADARLARDAPAADVAALCAELASGPEDVLICADEGAVRTAVGCALGAEAARIAVGPGATAVLDWPARIAGTMRPKLAGLEPDWEPPRSSGGRDGFPGGPGTARD